ncbi:MAG: hypothetical protein ACRDWA_10760 [Acidimicrobiia bacterium]
MGASGRRSQGSVVGHPHCSRDQHRPAGLRDAVPTRRPFPTRPTIDKAASGCQVRIALANPDSPYVAERDDEEGLGGTFPDRIRTTIDHFKPLFGIEGIDLRFHQTRMYNSVFRGDDEMFVTPHLYSLKGYRAPLLHIRRLADDGMFDGFVAHLERVWVLSEPIPAP